MRILSSIVAPSTAFMAFCDPKMTGCSSIRSQLICDELVWDKAIFLQKLAHEFQRGALVPFRLDQHIEDLALGVDGSPQIDHAAIAVAVRCPRVRDRVGEGGEHIRFSSTILPPYARRSKSLEVLIPILYLKGISTGDFEEALIALLGKDAGGLSASTIGRLKEAWSDEHTRWSKRDLSVKRYVYFWVDGIHVQARLEEAAQCLLVIIGATPEGKKELVGLIDGVRESAQSWKELLLDLKRRGLAMGPELAVADGALGFWQAIEEVWPRTRGQRCWVHKTANVLNKLPKSQQSKAKRALQEIWMAETKKDALAAFDAFIETWGVKYDKAVECLIKDRDALLAFYDFPAEHWKHLRTTNPIESSFATVRHRTVRSKGCLSNDSIRQRVKIQSP